MAKEIQAAQDQFHQELTDIATKYDWTFEAIVNMVSYSTKYKKKQAPSLYLARLSAKADEVNQEEEEASGSSGLTKDGTDALLEQLKEKRETKVQGAWADREGAAEDCCQVVDRLYQEVNNLVHLSDSSALLKFFKHVMGISAKDILVKYEQFFCAQSLNMNAHEDPSKVRSECTELIAKGLHIIFALIIETITGETNMHMNYVNYEMDIMAQHHIRLERWPMGIKFEKLSNLKNLQDLRQLRDALQTTACRWIRMSKKQVKKHDEDMKQHEVAGKTVRRKRWQ
ncbi:hypothetical protein IW261DRAFT_1571958 [Armillaria novae-zelandiae]|uniref:Uncharacterized protein n=1 Tax=Armillaria novae-zelandiae TaxID=153914 RepID=A0AA39NTB5_9AGAR|nr:hypothetical protein IW261DRAFT_1571958 [Armillaria novae-zelandiae]